MLRTGSIRPLDVRLLILDVKACDMARRTLYYFQYVSLIAVLEAEGFELFHREPSFEDFGECRDSGNPVMCRQTLSFVRTPEQS